jgi:hypothetical protein
MRQFRSTYYQHSCRYFLSSLLLWLIAIASIAVAMFVSTFIRTRSAAKAILPFVLIIQILLGGSIIKQVISMTPVVHAIANFMVSRWSFEAAALLFEKKLSLSMPRHQRDHDKQIDFTGISFVGTGALCLKARAPDTSLTDLEKGWQEKLENESLNTKPPDIVDKHPDIARYWYESLSAAIEDTPEFETLLDSEIYEVLSDYIEKLEQQELADEPFDEPIPLPALLKEYKPPVRLLEKAGKNFFREGDADGVYAKAVKRVLSGSEANLTEAEQLMLEHAMSTDSRLTFFRSRFGKNVTH